MREAHPILVGGAWIEDPHPTDTVKPINPSTGHEIGDEYPVSGSETLHRIAQHAAQVAEVLNATAPDRIALFLDTHAGFIDERRSDIASMAHTETGLPRSPRLVETEMNRTIDQLRQAAACVRSRDWMRPRVDTQNNLRSMFEPLGAGVLVIGPNNFPLAYNGAAGGDFAAAIAARNPVIAKSHPLHPGTSRMLAQCAHDAVVATDLPKGTVQFFYHCSPDDGLALIRNPNVSAVGFTGSRGAGLAMKKAADETGTPIYLELSSINPVFVLEHAVRDRGEAIADQIAESMLQASGQQCTSPGLIALRSSEYADQFIDQLSSRLKQASPQVMLSHDGRDGLDKAVQHNMNCGAECLIGGRKIDDDAARYEHTLLCTNASHFLEHHQELQEEMFGVAALIILCDDNDQFALIAEKINGNLTGTIHHSDCDAPVLKALTRPLRLRVGRLIHNAVPTGVHVSPATVHGGPFPATGHPGFTAVGLPTSIHRFCALRCYDRVSDDQLPPELRDRNPTDEMLRYIDGKWTRDDADE